MFRKDDTVHIEVGNNETINRKITDRLVEVVGILSQTNKIESPRMFFEKEGLYAHSYSMLQREGKNATLKMLHIAVSEYSVNADYLLSNMGKMFR